MFKKIGLILICGALGSTFSFNVRALPISPTPPQARGPNITFVAGGCGIGFHRGPYGACLRNGVTHPWWSRHMGHRWWSPHMARQLWPLGPCVRMATTWVRMAAVTPTETPSGHARSSTAV